MGFTNTYTASGQGSLDLGGLQNASEVAVRVITPATYATLTGVAGIRRVHQQGWIGLGFTPTAGPYDGIVLITWWKYIDMESITYLRELAFNVPADTLYYDIHEGGVMYLEVDWP